MNKKPEALSASHATIDNQNKLPKLSTIILIIIAAQLIIVAFVVSLLFTLEIQPPIQDKIASLSKDYYENYFYEELINSEIASDPTVFTETMQNYQDHGFGIVYLRQILSHNNQDDPTNFTAIADRCDENKTYVKYYPEPPFDRTSYRVEYTYSCNF